MIISKSNDKPKSIKINIALGRTVEVEVVQDFRLLGVTIDDKLTFDLYVSLLIKTINKKLFSMKKLFYLSFKVKLHFFKTFILPHLDYCASLFIYFKKTLLDKLERTYNSCLFNLLKIDLGNSLTCVSQQSLLSPFKLLSFYNRFLYRFSQFSYKVINNVILKEFKNTYIFYCPVNTSLRSTTRDIFRVTLCTMSKGRRALSYFLPNFCNKILRDNLNLSFSNFLTKISVDLILYTEIFKQMLANTII